MCYCELLLESLENTFFRCGDFDEDLMVDITEGSFSLSSSSTIVELLPTMNYS